MTRGFYALLAAMAIASSTGCCQFDNFFCHHWGCGPWGSCPSDDCAPCGHGDAGCSSCGGGGCNSCGLGGHVKHHQKFDHFPRGAGGEYVGPAGPPTGAVTYPYYTNRGPRDFLARTPASIGP